MIEEFKDKLKTQILQEWQSIANSSPEDKTEIKHHPEKF